VGGRLQIGGGDRRGTPRKRGGGGFWKEKGGLPVPAAKRTYVWKVQHVGRFYIIQEGEKGAKKRASAVFRVEGKIF